MNHLLQPRNIRALFAFFLFYLGFGVTLTFYQERLVYQPNDQTFADCPALRDATQVTLESTRLYRTNAPDAPTAVFYHGNAGSACDRAPLANLLTNAGYNYLLVEYTGYSNSPHTTTHETIKADIARVVTYLDDSNIMPTIIIGESIGTGAASYHTNLAPAPRLLLISPFTDLEAIAAHRFWFYPTSLLVDNAFVNTALLADYDGSVYIIHGEADAIIPAAHGTTLAESLTYATTSLTLIPDAGHNNLFTFPGTYTAFREALLQ